MPQISTPPIRGRVVRVHRMLGHHVAQHEPVIDVRVSFHLLTVCSPFAGKLMRATQVGELVQAGDLLIEVTDIGTETWEVFVNYRRSDAPGHAGRLGDCLVKAFGAGQVFKDIESLTAGFNFPEIIRARLKQAAVMVVIVGPNWLNDPRLESKDDLLREEIRTALERGIPIIPVTVHGAAFPTKSFVPADIRDFLDFQGIELTDTRWDHDAARLSSAVRIALETSPQRRAFLDQVPAERSMTGGWQWVADNPPLQYPNYTVGQQEPLPADRRDYLTLDLVKQAMIGARPVNGHANRQALDWLQGKSVIVRGTILRIEAHANGHSVVLEFAWWKGKSPTQITCHFARRFGAHLTQVKAGDEFTVDGIIFRPTDGGFTLVRCEPAESNLVV